MRHAGPAPAYVGFEKRITRSTSRGKLRLRYPQIQFEICDALLKLRRRHARFSSMEGEGLAGGSCAGAESFVLNSAFVRFIQLMNVWTLQ